MGVTRKWKWIALGVAAIVGVSTAAWAAGSTYRGYRTVTLLLEGKEVKSDVPPIIFDDRTLLPVRALAEAMGTDVKWDGTTYTVTLNTQPRLDTVQTASGMRMSLVGIKQRTAQEAGNDALAGQLVAAVSLRNSGTAAQEVDLTNLRLGTSADGSTKRTYLVPHILETSGSRRPAAGSTKVVLAPGEEVMVRLGFDLAESAAQGTRAYQLDMLNGSGEPEASLRISIKITIDCSQRPCTITIEIRF